MSKDIAFEMAVSSVRYGVGVTREVGMDLAEIGAKLVMVLTDPTVARLPPVQTVIDSLEQNGVAFALYDRVRVEPSDESFLDAIDFAALLIERVDRHIRWRLDHQACGRCALALFIESAQQAQGGGFGRANDALAVAMRAGHGRARDDTGA